MIKQIARLRGVFAFLLGILLLYSGAFAMEVLPNRGDDRRDNREDNRRDSREERHYYRNGNWHKRDSRGNEINVTVLSIGAIVRSLPPRHTTVVVEGARYYRDDRHYFRRRPEGGYVVVREPVRVQPWSDSNRDEGRERNDDRNDERNWGENH